MKTKEILLLMLILASWNIYAQKYPGELFPRDSVFFEYNTIPYYIDTSQPGNCWQVGHPSKVLFNEAYSPSLAIVTDTLLPYPVNTQSIFSFTITDTTFPVYYPPCGGATYLQFTHKFDTDTILDYGYMEYSFDHGASWNLTIDTIFDNGYYWGPMWFWWQPDYSVTSGDQYYHPRHISGHSNGWLVSQYIWEWVIPLKDSVIVAPDSIDVRFIFHSDNVQTNKEGWMIDNIVTGCMELGSGTLFHKNNDPIRISPVPLTTVSVVECSSGMENLSFEVYSLLGKSVFRKDIKRNSSFLLYRDNFYPGLFIWCLKSGDKNIQTGKLVVQ